LRLSWLSSPPPDKTGHNLGDDKQKPGFHFRQGRGQPGRQSGRQGKRDQQG
jgi:hypothetical protein